MSDLYMALSKVFILIISQFSVGICVPTVISVKKKTFSKNNDIEDEPRCSALVSTLECN